MRPLLTPKTHDLLTRGAESLAMLGGVAVSVILALAIGWFLGEKRVAAILERWPWIAFPVGVIGVPIAGAVIAFRFAVVAMRRVPVRCAACSGSAYRVGSRPATYRCRACGRDSKSSVEPAIKDAFLDSTRRSADSASAEAVDRTRRADVQGGALTVSQAEGNEGAVSHPHDQGQVSISAKK